ncbi:50S ribosomal protein L3 [Candidatus Parcubacteria bacterium]|nr:MAG: 50S ribosomal protein L3 [Candidatus Parcubacteria bacterium]
MNSLYGKKIDQMQSFLENGTRVPLSLIVVPANVVSQVKTTEKEGYSALQISFDTKKKTSKPLQGHIKKAGLKNTPRFFKEIKIDEKEEVSLGTEIKAEEIFKPGDVVDVTGISKGKGFAGGVKRYGFKGGPRTHGQSDRERAPGSIGQTTTPGRVYKGKKMAGRMGAEQVTIRNLEILDIKDNVLYIKGLVPGPKGEYLLIKKVGQNKKFIPLFKREDETPANTENIEASTEDTEKLATTESTEKSSEESVEPLVSSETAGETLEENSDKQDLEAEKKEEEK